MLKPTTAEYRNTKIKGIGFKLRDHILEIIHTGHCKLLNSLLNEEAPVTDETLRGKQGEEALEGSHEGEVSVKEDPTARLGDTSCVGSGEEDSSDDEAWESDKQYPPIKHTPTPTENLIELCTVWGIGPVKAKELYHVGFHTVAQLKAYFQQPEHLISHHKHTLDKGSLLSYQQCLGLKYFDDLQQCIDRPEVVYSIFILIHHIY